MIMVGNGYIEITIMGGKGNNGTAYFDGSSTLGDGGIGGNGGTVVGRLNYISGDNIVFTNILGGAGKVSSYSSGGNGGNGIRVTKNGTLVAASGGGGGGGGGGVSYGGAGGYGGASPTGSGAGTIISGSGASATAGTITGGGGGGSGYYGGGAGTGYATSTAGSGGGGASNLVTGLTNVTTNSTNTNSGVASYSYVDYPNTSGALMMQNF